MEWMGQWLIEKELGKGGQGGIYRARRFRQIKTLRNMIEKNVNHIRADGFLDLFGELFNAFTDAEVAAIKRLLPPAEAKNAATALSRFELEIKALKSANHPAIVRIVDENIQEKWFAMEYHRRGKLTNHLGIFAGRVRESLAALRPVVEAVGQLHAAGWIHRDIKPDNILLNDDGALVLGDAGLAYQLSDDDKLADDNRITRTGETVGSWQWMPIHAVGMRVKDVKPNFDVHCLGKVLWAMVSGKPFLLYHYFRRPDFDVRLQFSDKSDEMNLLDSFLEKCITEDLNKGLQTADQLLLLIDIYLEKIENQRIRNALPTNPNVNSAKLREQTE